MHVYNGIMVPIDAGVMASAGHGGGQTRYIFIVTDVNSNQLNMS